MGLDLVIRAGQKDWPIRTKGRRVGRRRTDWKVLN